MNENDRFHPRAHHIPDAMWTDFHNTERTGLSGCGLIQIPEDRDELIRLVGDALREKFGKQIFIDEDRDYVLHHMDQKVWVSVAPHTPAIRILARVGHDVYSRRATEVELGILNRDSLFCTWSLADRNVWQEASLVALPFAPHHLSVQLDSFFSAMSSTRDDLAYRIGAKVA